jgi:hypothetical protein
MTALTERDKYDALDGWLHEATKIGNILGAAALYSEHCDHCGMDKEPRHMRTETMCNLCAPQTPVRGAAVQCRRRKPESLKEKANQLAGKRCRVAGRGFSPVVGILVEYDRQCVVVKQESAHYILWDAVESIEEFVERMEDRL